MIKDQLYKCLFIPLAGILIALLAGFFSNMGESPLLIVLTIVFYTGCTWAAWFLLVRLTQYLRRQHRLQNNIPAKIFVLSLTGFLVATALYLVATFIGLRLGIVPAREAALWGAAVAGGGGGLLLVLVYEIVFLSIDKEKDSRVLQQVHRARHEAESSVLKNELEPHFFFNCMNTLSHLVQHDADKAYQFVHKLSNVYKYFLRNKGKEYVSLTEEMEFLDNYYFLLQIRYDDNIHIHKNVEAGNGNVLILPCTLQVLVENAIKHNFFSEKEPLEISITQNGQFIQVSNPVRPKSHVAGSGKTGLRNLQARYRLLTDQNISVQKTTNKFLVKLPIVKTIHHDKSSDY